MADTFTCKQCGQTFDKVWSDEEAAAEMRENFGDIPEGQRVIVCDPCFEAMKAILPLGGGE